MESTLKQAPRDLKSYTPARVDYERLLGAALVTTAMASEPIHVRHA